jgi:hypothetical protein
MTHDQHLRAAEERRRREILERGSQMLRVLVAPQRAPRAAAPGEQPLPQDAERALDQEGLVAVEQVVRAERSAFESRERVGDGAAPSRLTRRAQKPSMACE